MGIVGVIILLVGISFATFSSDISGVKVQGIQTGCLKVDMTDNGNLNISNAAPMTNESGLASSPYTYTITNNCTIDASFITTLNIMNNSNLDNLSKIKVSLDGDSYLAPTVVDDLAETELVDSSESSVVKTYSLDTGYLKVGESKTFDLRTWIDYDVESISGGLSSKIIILSTANNSLTIEYNTNTSGYIVASKNSLLPSPDYSIISPSDSQPSGIVKVDVNDGVKYYFRGNPNNYLTFAGLDFRILSTNPDGSINIVLDDIADSNTYNNILTVLNTWYDTNIKSEEKYIKTNQTFCEELSNSEGVYLPSIRVDNHNPSGECMGSTMTKVGLLTVDDLMFAGAVYNTENSEFYLNSTTEYFTSSSGNAYNVYTYSNNINLNLKTTNFGIKPVITLSNDVNLSGSGTLDDPFYIVGLFSEEMTSADTDDISPEIISVRFDERWAKENKQLEIMARDNASGSGIAGYMITTSYEIPEASDSGWEASSSLKYTSVNSYDNGTYYVFVKDNAGNVSDGKEVVIDKVDKVAPSCRIRVNPNGYYSDNKTLSIINTNNDHIDINGYSWDQFESVEDAISINENGVFTGYLTDLAGNVGSCTAVVTNVIFVQNTAIDVSVPDTGYQTEKEVNITFTSSDSRATLDSYCISTSNNSESCQWTTIPGSVTTYSTTYTATAEGIYYIFVKDVFDNISDMAVSVTNIGPPITTPPTVTTSTPSTAYATSKKITLSFESSDSRVALASYCVSTSSTSSSCSWTSIPGSVTSYQTTYTATSARTYYVFARDELGNTSTGKAVKVTNIGTPVTSISVSATSPIWILNSSKKTTTAKATVSPSSAALKSVTWSSSKTSVATVNSSGVITPVSNGTTTIKATAKDGSGKSGSVTVRVYKATAPTSTISSVSTGKESSKRTMYLSSHSLSASNGSSTVTVTINGYNKGGNWLGTAGSSTASYCSSYSRWAYLSGPTNTQAALIKPRSTVWGNNSYTTTTHNFCGAVSFSASTAGTYYMRVNGMSYASCNECGQKVSASYANSGTGYSIWSFSSYSLRISH